MSNYQRVIIGFGIVISLFVGFGLFTLSTLQNLSQFTSTIYNHPLVVSNASLQANVMITKMHRNMKDVVLFESLSDVDRFIRAVDDEEVKVYEHLDIVKSKILGEKGRELERKARIQFANWKSIRSEVIDLVKKGDRKKAAAITVGKGADHVDLLEKNMLGLTDYARAKATDFMGQKDKEHKKARSILILFLISIIGASVVISFITLKQSKKSERLLRSSEQRYRSLIETQTDLVSRFTPDGNFTFVNDVFCRFFNKTKEEIVGGVWHPLPVEEDIPHIQSQLAKLSTENPTVVIENRIYSDQGAIHWMQFVNQAFFDSSGKMIEIQSVGRDITKLKEYEKQIEKSLQEKEVLLKEVHHRVKNNMQVIQSLLSLQLNTLEKPDEKKPLIDSGNRIQSMALIHETLYRSEDIARLDIATYFDSIVQHLFKIYNVSDIQIDILVEIDSQDLDMDACIACGLIINELISNALKYAFKDKKNGQLFISLKRAGQNRDQGSLIVGDDGCGLPDGFTIEECESLGLKIVKILTQGQLNGHLNVASEAGTVFDIKFPLSIH